MAARYWVGGNATWDNTAGTKWATTSGGAGGAAVPTNSDDVFLDNGTGTGNVTTSTISSHCICNSMICTGYVGTLTVNTTITVSGSVTLVAAMTITSTTGTPMLKITGPGTLTSNGKAWPYTLQFSSAGSTITLADDWTVSMDVNNNNGSHTLNGNNLYIGTDLTLTATGLSGTTTLIMNGTGTYSGSGVLQNNLTFDSAGTITVSGSGLRYGAKTITRVGTTNVVTTGSTVAIQSSCTMNTGTMAWNNITVSASTTTLTLSSDLTLNGTLTIGVGTTLSGSFNVNVAGSLTTNAILSGATAVVVMNGTGTWSGTGSVTCALTFNGTITITGAVAFNTKTMSKTGGTVTATAATLTVAASCTLDTDINWGNVTISAAITLTLNTLLSVAGTLICNQTVSFLGTAGFTVATFSSVTAGRTITWKNGNTYTITTTLTVTGTQASKIIFASSTPTSSYNFVLNSGGTCNVSFVDSRDADSSAGRIIHDRKGVLLRTVNWYITNPDFFPLF